MSVRHTNENGSGTRMTHSNFWTDDPISRPEEDSYGRNPVAQRMAEHIARTHRYDSSTVFGLRGKWGSGKTSMIALITNALQSNPDSAWTIVEFEPWATTGTEGLLTEFLAVMTEAAPKGRSKRKIRKQFRAWLEIVKPLSGFVPVVGGAVGASAQELNRRLEKPWTVVFEEICNEFLKNKQKILVIIDDIDRMQPDELQTLLKVIRKLGRFPGVNYLLAYDEDSVADTLAHPARGVHSPRLANDFLEKIVQHTLTVPILLQEQRQIDLKKGIDRSLSRFNLQASQMTTRISISRPLLKLLASELTTPRAIERFLAQLDQDLSAYDLEEIYVHDLILALFIKHRFFRVYEDMQTNKEDLVDKDPPSHDFLERHTKKDERHHSIIGDAIEMLFPKRGVTVHQKCIQNPRYFDRYFTELLPSWDVSDSDVEDACAEACDGNAAPLIELINSENYSRGLLALEKARNLTETWSREYASDALTGIDLSRLLAQTIQIFHSREPGSRSPHSVSESLRAWCRDLFFSLLGRATNAQLLDAIRVCDSPLTRALIIFTGPTDTVRNSDWYLNNLKKAERALEELREEELPFLRDDFFKNHYAGRQADILASPFHFYLLSQNANGDDLKTRFQQELSSERFNLEDVGARLTYFDYSWETPPIIAAVGFDAIKFEEWTGMSYGIRDISMPHTEFDESPASRYRAFLEYAFDRTQLSYE